MSDLHPNAYYLPGKTVEEMRAAAAEQARQDAKPYCTITLSAKEQREYEAAAMNAEYLLISASGILDMLQAGFSTGCIDPTATGTLGLMEMAARGYRAAMEDEGDKLRRLSLKIRDEKELIHAD